MSEGRKGTVRCAIYTRKSSEEGLDQSFNSLDAQREACQAYILSQRQEGWKALNTHYDDGGYSGGNMQRPALKQLMADIAARKVDIVVVYKVDRLTRSLADFAKIVEAFDAQGVSFVSVTQQFNTTSSMGRLTLNVLLSFAQFEREVTGERIRDKIAASKRKGMWMGGRVPLGYDLKERKLVINREEADRVREIFSAYLEFGCVRKLKAHLDKHGIRSGIRISRTGKRSGGMAYSRGALYKILQNRIYLGEIPHKKASYNGEHEAIITQELWQQVRAKLAENMQAQRHSANAHAPSMLRGLLFNENGNRFTPSHAVKDGKRYRYYVCQHVPESGHHDPDATMRLPAKDVEDVVATTLKNFLASPDQIVRELTFDEDDVATTRELVEAAGRHTQGLDTASTAQLHHILIEIGVRVTVLRESVRIQLSTHALRAWLLAEDKTKAHSDAGSEDDWITIEILARLERRRGEVRLIIPGTSAISRHNKPIPSLVKAISKAHEWMRRIESGEFNDQRAIAAAYKLNERYVGRILPVAFLAPEIVEGILDGMHSPILTLKTLLKETPLNWNRQVTLERP